MWPCGKASYYVGEYGTFETVIDTKRNAVVIIEHCIRTDSGVKIYIVHDEETDDHYIASSDHLIKYDKYYFERSCNGLTKRHPKIQKKEKQP